MIDSFGREITYLRVSVTDRCNLRCSYCMAEDMVFRPRSELLSLEELDRICSVFIGLGVRKLRITGGEPLVRRGVMTLFKSLGHHLASGALDELTLTTNATRLSRHAAQLAACGVRRVNVSLDTLDAAKFERLTRGGRIGDVLDGIAEATAAGLAVKVNTVVLRGINDGELDDLIAWCGERGFGLTLIETMPLGEIEANRAGHYLPLLGVRARLADRWTLTDLADGTGGPARYVLVGETGCRLGFIAPMSQAFCAGCNRVRLTCTGRLYLCLGRNETADLRAVVKDSESDGPLIAAIEEAITRKPLGHAFVIDPATKRPAIDRHMSVTGG